MSIHLSFEQLEHNLAYILDAPADQGELKLIVTRPVSGQRVLHQSIELSAEKGVTGDKWSNDCWLKLEDGSSDPDVQICIMSARCIEIAAADKDRWALAGDNLYIDMDLSINNLQPGDRLTLGSSLLEITAQPHDACLKFTNRFGREASRFVNNQCGRENRLRGIYAKVIINGEIKVGDKFCKVTS